MLWLLSLFLSVSFAVMKFGKYIFLLFWNYACLYLRYTLKVKRVNRKCLCDETVSFIFKCRKRIKYCIKYLEQRLLFHTKYLTQFTVCRNKSQNNSVYSENIIFRYIPHILIGNVIQTSPSHLRMHCFSCVIIGKIVKHVLSDRRILCKISVSQFIHTCLLPWQLFS